MSHVTIVYSQGCIQCHAYGWPSNVEGIKKYLYRHLGYKYFLGNIRSSLMSCQNFFYGYEIPLTLSIQSSNFLSTKLPLKKRCQAIAFHISVVCTNISSMRARTLFIALSSRPPVVRVQIFVKRMNYLSVLLKVHCKEIRAL